MANVDCCTTPTLEVHRLLLDRSHNTEAVERCSACGASWFYRWWEHVSFDGPDEATSWYTRITDAEAATLIAAPEHPDLAFLRLDERPSIMIDDRGVHRVPGAPTGTGPGAP